MEIKWTSSAFYSNINFKVYVKEISYLYKRKKFCTKRVQRGEMTFRVHKIYLFVNKIYNLQISKISSKWSELYLSGLTPFRYNNFSQSSS